MSNDDSQREIYEMRAKTLRDKISALNEAERKGMEKGIKEGKKEGIKEGMEKGIKEGIKEGEKNKAIEIAKSLLDVLDVETISLKTGLSVEEIEGLK